MKTVASNDYMAYADIRDRAASVVRRADEVLEAARTVRDRAAAAHLRGLRPDDVTVMKDAQAALEAALALAAEYSTDLGQQLAPLAAPGGSA